MELNIGKKLRQLRREREITQEEMANHLGISFQAISKWERGDGYPDITMLPLLAGYFSVSVDSLLGMDEESAWQRYDEINRTWSDNRTAARHRENVELMEEALREYPNDPLMLVQLSASLERLAGQAETPAEKREHIRRSVEVQERILRYCDDCEVRGATMYNICFSYEKLGMHDKAVEQARKLPNLYKARENALAVLLDGEEKREAARAAIPPLIWAVELHLKAIAGDDETNIARIEKIKKLINETV